MISNNQDLADTSMYNHTLSKDSVGMTFKVRTTTHFFHTPLFSITIVPTFVKKEVHGFHENITWCMYIKIHTFIFSTFY